MKEVHFPDWEGVLRESGLPAQVQKSYRITIRWYLSYCRRCGAGVTVQSARDFMNWVERHETARVRSAKSVG